MSGSDCTMSRVSVLCLNSLGSSFRFVQSRWKNVSPASRVHGCCYLSSFGNRSEVGIRVDLSRYAASDLCVYSGNLVLTKT